MFGKRASAGPSSHAADLGPASAAIAEEAPKPPAPAPVQAERRSESYFQTKSLIFGALIEAIDLAPCRSSTRKARARKFATSCMRSSR
jgi:pilus assembly protein CpaF